jgi:hypothetical protein
MRMLVSRSVGVRRRLRAPFRTREEPTIVELVRRQQFAGYAQQQRRPKGIGARVDWGWHMR